MGRASITKSQQKAIISLCFAVSSLKKQGIKNQFSAEKEPNLNLLLFGDENVTSATLQVHMQQSSSSNGDVCFWGGWKQTFSTCSYATCWSPIAPRVCVRARGRSHDRVAVSSYTTVEMTGCLMSTCTDINILYNLLVMSGPCSELWRGFVCLCKWKKKPLV